MDKTLKQIEQEEQERQEREDAEWQQLEPDEHGLSERDKQRVAHFNNLIKTFGPEKAAVMWAASEQRRKDERVASRKWYETDRQARLWMMRTRLLEAAELSDEEEKFYLAFISLTGVAHETGPTLPACLATHDLWQGYDRHRGPPDNYFNLLKVFGSLVHRTLVPTLIYAEEVQQAREMLKAEGLWGLSEQTKRARHRRGGYAGDRRISQLIGAPQYWPLVPCRKDHPPAPFLTKYGNCSVCREVEVEANRRRPMEQWQKEYDKRAKATARKATDTKRKRKSRTKTTPAQKAANAERMRKARARQK